MNGRGLRWLKPVHRDESGVIDRVEFAGLGTCSSERGVETLHIGVGPGDNRFSDLDLEHKMGTALEVEPEMDTVRERLLETAVRDAKDPVDEDHEHRDDEACFSGQIFAHCFVTPLPSEVQRLNRLHSGVSCGTTEAVAVVLSAARLAGKPGCLQR